MLLVLRGCLYFECRLQQEPPEKGKSKLAASQHQPGCGQEESGGESSSAGIGGSFDDEAEGFGAERELGGCLWMRDGRGHVGLDITRVSKGCGLPGAQLQFLSLLHPS